MSFAALPAELQQQIIAEVLDLPPSSLSSTSPTPHLCSAPDAAALASTSRSCNALVTPLLYRHVRATSPSSLRELEATLMTRPDLAALITKLHIGADRELPGKGWPIVGFPDRATPPVFQIGTTLMKGQRPRWCEASARFSIKDPRLEGEVTPMERAIQAAMKNLDVDPFRREYSLLAEEKIGMRAWSARLFLLQAAVDIYLVKMKEVEDSRGYDATTGISPKAAATRHSSEATLHCGPYPSLKIIFNTIEPTLEPTPGFTISVGELWNHLLKRGGPADHFEHLVRLSHSTARSLGIGTLYYEGVISGDIGWSRVRYDLSGPYSVSHNDSGPLSWSERRQRNDLGWPAYDDLWLEGGPRHPIPTRSESNPLSEASSGGEEARRALDGEKVEDLIELGKSVLALAPNVLSLALTSYFHRALSSLRSPKILRSLVIGPKARYWDKILPDLCFVWGYRDLARIRVVGMMHKSDAKAISECLPRQLDKVEVEWELAQEQVNEWDVFVNIDNLHGEIQNEEQRKASTHFDFSNRSTTVLLHLNSASNQLHRVGVRPAKLEAWKKGSRVPGHTHTVRVAASDAIMPAGRNGPNVDRTDVRALYAKSLRWWLEG